MAQDYIESIESNESSCLMYTRDYELAESMVLIKMSKNETDAIFLEPNTSML